MKMRGSLSLLRYFLLTGLIIMTLTSSATTGLLAELGGIEYQGVYQQPVKLNDGFYEGPPFVEGGASRPVLRLVDNLVAQGALAGEQSNEAVVLLVENSGGSGSFLYLAVVGIQNGVWKNLATVLLGDRVQVRALTIENRRIIVDTIGAGAEDIMAEPRTMMRAVYALNNDSLERLSAESKGKLTIRDLDNSYWRLSETGDARHIDAGVRVTAKFASDGVSGFAGCNAYQANIEDGSEGTIKMGLVMATRKMCAPDIMAVETDFLAQIRAVNGFRFDYGRLVLTFAMEESTGSLFFERMTDE